MKQCMLKNRDFKNVKFAFKNSQMFVYWFICPCYPMCPRTHLQRDAKCYQHVRWCLWKPAVKWFRVKQLGQGWDNNNNNNNVIIEEAQIFFANTCDVEIHLVSLLLSTSSSQNFDVDSEKKCGFFMSLVGNSTILVCFMSSCFHFQYSQNCCRVSRT